MIGEPIGITLRSSAGRVIGPDIHDGDFLIRLDVPALYRRADETTEELSEIAEYYDNLDLLSDESP